MSTRADRLRDLLSSKHLRHAEIRADAGSDTWTRANLSGRLVEISGQGATASLTAAIGLVHEAQREGEPTAWITLPGSIFYPPDVADTGVDLAALAVVRVGSGRDAARAADRLIRSGAFGLVVLDLARTRGTGGHIAMALQGRLVGLAQKHDTAVVCVTDKSTEAASIGSMVSLRVEVMREAIGAPAGGFRCKVAVLKDKQRGPSWHHAEVVRGPAGLR
ncbi:MAG TPA: recombinase A [Kofleriaceae bacterium]|nr:recombinase A [Kofleriaceae bacterium]